MKGRERERERERKRERDEPFAAGKGAESTTRRKELSLVVNTSAELTAIHSFRQVLRLLG